MPALGPWTTLLLGCVLGIVAVLALRKARRVGLLLTLSVLVAPLTALAGVPFIFPPGSIPHAHQLNENFAALIPLVGKYNVGAALPTHGSSFVFPTSPAFVAPRDLNCVVTVEPYVVIDIPGAVVAWSTAIKIGATQSIGPQVGPAPLVLEQQSSFAPDTNYFGTYTEVFRVTRGSSVSFGAQFLPLSTGPLTFFQPNVNVVYTCTPVP